MLRAYFDTNIYDHIDKGWVPAEEVDALSAALRRREVVAHLSLADIEELLGQWETDRLAAIRKLRLARDLVGFDGLLKQPADLLTEAIQAYAVGAPPPSATLSRYYRRFLAACLNKVADESTTFNGVVSNIVGDVAKNKKEFLAGMADADARASAELKSSEAWREAKGWVLTFDAFWAKAASSWAEDFAHRLGLAGACRERGLDGLLAVRTVRLSVGAMLSLVFSQVVEGREPHRGDGYDLWHAVLASVADVFVTFDERLAGNLVRVPMDGFRVVTSLPALLTG